MQYPQPRGPVSSMLFETLHAQSISDPLPELEEAVRAGLDSTEDILFDEDLQLTLFCLYELHYSGLENTDERWEWSPALLSVRARLEERFEAALRAGAELPSRPTPTAAAVADALFALVADDGGPSLFRYAAKDATADQLCEFLIQRSMSQLREADPQTWAIPRLTGPAKAALVEIQADEYGGGRPDRVHAVLYARAMRAAGLSEVYGAYLDQVPAIMLASVNLTSFFGLHRRLRGAIVGQLAAYEMTSAVPLGFFARGLRRHHFHQDVVEYFDEHVEADSVHEQIAARDMAGALVAAHPELLDDVLFGAVAGQMVDGLSSRHMLDSWKNGLSSLRSIAPQHTLV